MHAPAHIAQFIAETEPANEHDQWRTLATQLYTIAEHRLWVVRRVKPGADYEGMPRVVFLAIVILEEPNGELELLAPDEESTP